ncbi:BREX system ATP-binding domain-containing protein [Bacillus cereus]|uniref:BREX system ATP-binding domain-containing protein n=1 Tax=Bacillus cereus TaxID=1396 RepID=UPI00124D5854|nr:BREX system ATP-binding domain-containing protein [Bacillus cereus]KAB2481420.1 hypothetical protein F8159_08525 [Bacillus cereus]
MYDFEKLFENEGDLSADVIRRELSGMRNTEPPERPTFIINQQNVKDVIAQKFSDCYEGFGFSHVVLTGKIGGGKTHFLNWIESRLKKQGEFYTIKFQVQETNIVKYSLVRMIVAKVFQNYYTDFSSAFTDFTKNIQIEKNDNRDVIISKICEEFDITSNLAILFYALYEQNDKSSAALRIIGASHGRTEIQRLKIKELNDNDYIKIIEMFLNHKSRSGFLLILLDEFEHAFSSLTVNARNKFFVSYKEFIGKAIQFNQPSVALITSVTEQYEGNLESAVSKNEQALWTRLKPQITELLEFNPTNNEEFMELFMHLSTRYKVAYKYDIGEDYPQEMKKYFLDYIGGRSTQAISYRDAISNMIKIMDELRMRKKSLGDIREEKSKEIENYLVLKSDPTIKTDKERILEEVSAQWRDAHHNKKPGLIKSALEKIYVDSNYNLVRLKDYDIEETSALLCVENREKIGYIYISTAATPKSLADKFQKCLDVKDRISSKINDREFDAIFIYLQSAETASVRSLFRAYPDVKTVSLELNELYNILAYSRANTEILKGNIMEDFIMNSSLLLIDRKKGE